MGNTYIPQCHRLLGIQKERKWNCCYFYTPCLVFFVHCHFYYHVHLLQLTIQLAQCGFAEFVLHLTRMNPDMMYLHQDSGFLNISYFKFDIDDTTGKTSLEFESYLILVLFLICRIMVQ